MHNRPKRESKGSYWEDSYPHLLQSTVRVFCIYPETVRGKANTGAYMVFFGFLYLVSLHFILEKLMIYLARKTVVAYKHTQPLSNNCN